MYLVEVAYKSGAIAIRTRTKLLSLNFFVSICSSSVVILVIHTKID